VDKINKSKEEWQKELTPEQYEVMFEHETERPFVGKYYLENSTGIYHCGACGNPLFKSDAKFDSGCGWPSFFEPISKDSIEYREDDSFDMMRTEVVCARCGAHLGHVFEDAPEVPTGQRYCINSISLNLEKGEK
jgi:peptide-methionine (R)-S-oxide reductase